MVFYGHNVMYITLSHASHDAERRFYLYDRSMFNKLEPLNLSFFMNFLKISNEIGRAWFQTSFGM